MEIKDSGKSISVPGYAVLAALVVLGSTSQASAMGKPVRRIESSDLYGKTIRSLLASPAPGAPEAFTEESIIAGPFETRDDHGALLSLSMNVQTKDEKTCFRLSKEASSLEDLKVAAEIEEAGCSGASKEHFKAALPDFQGYTVLTDEGKKAIAAISAQTWEFKRKYSLQPTYKDEEDGSTRKAGEPFTLTLKNSFRLWMNEDFSGASIQSDSSAFNERSSAPPSVPLLRTLEKRQADGTLSILLYPKGSPYYVSKSVNLKKVSFAGLYPSFYQARRVDDVFMTDENGNCETGSCDFRDDREDSGTRFYSFEYLVVSIDPAHPESIVLEVRNISGKTPELVIPMTRQSSVRWGD